MKWYKNGTPIDIKNLQKYSFTQSGASLQLCISNAEENDSGEYTCRVELPDQPIKTISHNVDVPTKKVPIRKTQQNERQTKKMPSEQRDSMDAENKPISLESFMKNLTIEEGNRAKFICSVIGQVQSVDWLKDNIPLKIATDPRYRVTRSDGLVGLEIYDVMPSDSGFYTCTIRGRRNSVTSSSKLTIYESYNRNQKPSTKSIRPSSIIPLIHESISRGKHFPLFFLFCSLHFKAFLLFFINVINLNLLCARFIRFQTVFIRTK